VSCAGLLLTRLGHRMVTSSSESFDVMGDSCRLSCWSRPETRPDRGLDPGGVEFLATCGSTALASLTDPGRGQRRECA
jgi:hypothetical protein